jgi:hypothetical protein
MPLDPSETLCKLFGIAILASRADLAELGDLRDLLAARDNAATMRMQLAKHVKEIVLSPGENDTIKYKGEWALLGDDSRRECAEGQNRTGYAGLFRAALYR